MADEATLTPFQRVGGAEKMRELIERFYELMFETEPALTRLHRTGADGRVDEGSRQRFALFVMGWLGGPQSYTEQHGHPRLRMRHARVAVDVAMRDAWLRCMQTAMTELQIAGPVRTYLDERFAEVAEHMRNTAA
jgi:hemoglobin